MTAKKNSGKPAKKTAVKTGQRQAAKNKNSGFTVVAVGASAGGLEAFSELVKHLPKDTGMAFIYVQHLSPDHKSLLTSILSKLTTIKVQEIDDMELMEPNNIYVIPPDKGIEVTDGHIKLLPRSKNRASVSIDVLFSSLAQTHKEDVIGIILSGSGKDGSKGLKAIKDAGGITFAQNDSAKASGMPQSVIEAGVVDYVMSPKAVARKLASIGKKKLSKLIANPGKTEKETDPNMLLLKILQLLHKEINVDFSGYKMATIKRRISHRMQQCSVKSLQEYFKLLSGKKEEIQSLYDDLLINVTCFFRDIEVFNFLEKKILPDLVKSKLQESKLRFWVPACSTGEEAYSFAILLTELLEKTKNEIFIQVFATDLSESAIRQARVGEYTSEEIRHLDKKRIERFFTKSGNNYRVNKKLREMCVFATHNILSDPPFSRIDFISCRNLLIYFESEAQKKVLSTMNFALNEGGLLLLGKSESAGVSSQLFTQINKKFKLFSKKKTTGHRKLPELIPQFPVKHFKIKNAPESRKQTRTIPNELDNIIDATLLEKYMPACVIINKNMEILKFRGSTSLFLSHPQGNANLNILKMIRPEFSIELRSAILSAIKTNAPVTRQGIAMNPDTTRAQTDVMSLDVCPLKIEWDEPLLAVIFKEQQVPENYQDVRNLPKKHSKAADLIRKQTEELNKARAEMQAVIEAQEKAYEELQVANEEIVSAGEEFQTLNEELETSKEEIEATNEELSTTNQELQIRNEQLGEAYEFSKALAATMHEPMLVLDKNLRIKSANKAFYKYFMVLESDTEGKLLYELGDQQWDIPRLRELLRSIALNDTNFNDFEITNEFPLIGKKTLILNAARIVQKSQNEQLILLTLIDATLRTQRHKGERKNLKNIIDERTSALEQSVAELGKKNATLKKLNKELETFTFISSHDLQEPLRKIKTFANLLKGEEKDLSANGKVYLGRMEATVNRMQGLIQDLLEYSHIENSEKKFEKTDLSEIIKEVADDLDETILEKKAEIKVEVNCQANIIRFQFRQLIENLLSNALKFSHPKRFPRILIKSTLIKGNVIPVKGIVPQKKYCHLSVIDNGIGFDPQYKDRIFEVFQRLHEYNEYNGTGIGLAICKRIVENHNGVITASGKLNKGAQFDIYIPLT